MLPLKEIGYFHAQCKAQMKKLLYIVLLKLEINGTIEVSHCEQNGELKLKIKHNYYTQIQGQLFCTNRKFCNLIVYTFKDMKVIYIERDTDSISEIILNFNILL